MILLMFLQLAKLTEDVIDILQVINQINNLESKKIEDKDTKNDMLLYNRTNSVNGGRNIPPIDNAGNGNLVEGLLTAGSQHKEVDNNDNITENIFLIYKKDKNTVYHLRKENLICKIIESSDANNSESKISLMMNHKNVAKAFLTVLAKKGNNYIEIIIGPYYEGEINESTIRNADDIRDLSQQLGKGLNYLHDQKVIHGDIYPANIRFTIYDKTINELQKKFIVRSYENIKARIEKDSQNPCEDNTGALKYLKVEINEKSLCNEATTVKLEEYAESRVYVLIDFNYAIYFGPEDTYTGSIIYKPTSHDREEIISRENAMKKDIYEYADTLYYISQIVIYKNKNMQFNIDWDAWEVDIPARFSMTENSVEQLLWQCTQEKLSLRPSFKIILKNFPRNNEFVKFVENQPHIQFASPIIATTVNE